LLLHPIQQPQTPLSPLRQCDLRNDLVLARTKNDVSCLGCSLGPLCWSGSTRLYILFLQKMNIHIYNLYLILKIFEYNVLLVRQLHLVSFALLPSRHGFKPTSCIIFLTFYAGLIKWADGLTAGPTQSAGRHDVLGRVVARGCLAYAGPPFSHL
jgi:hypothetical protein